MLWLFLLLAVIAGAILPVQVALNARLGLGVGNPALAALVSFLVGSAALLAYCLVTRVQVPPLASLRALPPAGWLGGILGAFYVPMTVILAPRLGTAVLFGLVVVGQLLTSLIIDHFGLFGIAAHRASLMRVLGVLLVVGGVALFRRF